MAELDGLPRSLMTCRMVPVPPRDTVTMVRKRTPERFGAAKARSAVTLGLTLQ
ncbi:hypothetical protein [Streptomyces sp. GESEQ-13]|uniref:hypothetical protein n=1 Tax=Streptomyces sp. GESEQ-13 TaxID=2812654 RepID=UPI001B3278F4